MSTAYPLLPSGRTNYEFVSRIPGPGAFGELWAVRVHPDSNFPLTFRQDSGSRPYACKVVREQYGINPDDINNELRAIRRICTTGHQNIVQVFAEWRQFIDGVSCCFIVMELCRYNFEHHLNTCHKSKETIQDWWFYRETGLFSMELELDIMSGLLFIHGMNEIHRDLKPANVLLDVVNNVWVCKVADFGFTSVGESGQQYSSTQGRMTIIYSAPELIIHGKYSKKSDIWAMGCILYEVCFAPHDRRKAFATTTAMTSYYFNETIAPPQIGWDNLGIRRETIPEYYMRNQDKVEKRWDGLNIIFAAVFRRKPEERPTALELRDNLQLIAKGKEPTLTDYRLSQGLVE